MSGAGERGRKGGGMRNKGRENERKGEKEKEKGEWGIEIERERL